MSLFEAELQNLVSLGTVRGMMQGKHRGCVGKGDRFAKVHQQGQETQQRAQSMHGKANSILAGGTMWCVPFGAQERKPAGIEVHSTHPESDPWPKAVHRELLRRGTWRDMGCGHGKGQKNSGTEPWCHNEPPAEADLGTPIPSMVRRWSRSVSDGSSKLCWDPTTMKPLLRPPLLLGRAETGRQRVPGAKSEAQLCLWMGEACAEPAEGSHPVTALQTHFEGYFFLCLDQRPGQPLKTAPSQADPQPAVSCNQIRAGKSPSKLQYMGFWSQPLPLGTNHGVRNRVTFILARTQTGRHHSDHLICLSAQWGKVMRMCPAIPAAFPGFLGEVMGTSCNISNSLPAPQVCAYPQPKEMRAECRFQKDIMIKIITLELHCWHGCVWGGGACYHLWGWNTDPAISMPLIF